MFIFLFILVTLLFYLQDIFIFKQNKINKFLFIRIISTLLIGIGFYYVLNLNFKFDLETSILVPFVINGVINFFIKNDKKVYKTLLSFLVIACLLETTVFNFKHYQTLTNEEITPTVTQVTLVDEVEEETTSSSKQSTSTKETEKEASNSTAIIKKTTVVEPTEYEAVEVNIKDVDLTSLYVSVNNRYRKYTYAIKVKDLESGEYIELNKTNDVKKNETSHYKIIHNTFDADYMYLVINNAEKEDYDNIVVKLNPQIPVLINYVRILMVFAVLALVYLFKTTAKMYQTKISTMGSKLKLINLVFGIISIIICLLIFSMNSYWKANFKNDVGDTFTKINPYQQMAKSLSKGDVTIGIEPDEILLSVDDPYNPNVLYNAYKNTGKTYLWDTAFYKGKYYCYYGVVPIVLAYLPFYTITHKNLENITLMVILVSIIIINIIILVKRLCLKHFKNISLGTYLLTLIMILFANHFVVLYACQRADFYTIPLMFAMMFNLAGINLLLTAKEKNLNKWYLFFGGLCLALVAGCRPQLILGSIFALVIFKDEIKEIFKSKKFGPIITFILPYILVAIPLMYYNYIRFDSPFDFGANYNLTTNNMLRRGFNIDRIGLGLYYYLFASPTTSSAFPFIKMLSLNTSYIGTTIYEMMFGGLFLTMPLAIFGALSFKFKKEFNNKSLYYTTLILNIMSIIIIILDVEMAGILPRYNIDFYIMIMMSSALTILSIFNNRKEPEKQAKLNKYFFIMIVLLLILNFNMLFIDVSMPLNKATPRLYYFFYYLIQFWL